MRRYLAAAALAALSFLPADARAARVYVRIGPPAPIVETRIVAPSRRHVWIAGYHRWDGQAYVWVPGRWELPPAHRRAWVRGHWVHERRNGWYWVDGHWR
jgi:WXXGXW repeat (2 copies)